ncbi:NUDIX domain-containing protein [Nocardioides sp. P5_C9_2]
MASLPRRQRVAAYAVILRTPATHAEILPRHHAEILPRHHAEILPRHHAEILLCRLAPRISRTELWTLPGGGLDHGEDPRDALLREIVEETGLEAVVGDSARVYSAHLPRASRDGVLTDFHALRIVYDAWVRADAPEPRVLEVDGSTIEAAWHPVAAVASGVVPVVATVTEALADHRPMRVQRVAAYAVVRRDSRVLLTRLSATAAHPGSWTLPGGGIDHGERPSTALVREVLEECGVECEVGELLGVHDTHFSGTAPSGRWEDYHGVHLLFDAHVATGEEPRVVEIGGTTDDVAWVEVADISSGAVPVLDVVTHALSLAPSASGSAPGAGPTMGA